MAVLLLPLDGTRIHRLLVVIQYTWRETLGTKEVNAENTDNRSKMYIVAKRGPSMNPVTF